ncbi:GntR family transcriptional regulator [Listeria booriae]|uniref:GntR family transcriptional regulator n=1 Tax=Listeria booriae TaxID=1552123 RepID=A0A7X0XEZ5_9LIST|nr:GntR family transcriptional regulator [Listeria booriae]MBC1231168.1 GntR family transcriptional regulator [Listeria booriae]MBC1291365.1 GntR family transcriptional regulator [Listeria booriae]MBC1335728.1 GntR family transcriptional regulator [Listeria booriae]MBC1492892.1 GntR family transcriptional regulator [Listeria booriae]MBC1504569.1 GntR family transcriptional regulator [Listeria booriae]
MENSKTRLEEIAYEHILKYIIDGTYAAGDFVNQRDLTEELNMSRTPIKAALARLSGEGYIRVFPYSGAFVSHYQKDTEESEDKKERGLLH